MIREVEIIRSKWSWKRRAASLSTVWLEEGTALPRSIIEFYLKDDKSRTRW